MPSNRVSKELNNEMYFLTLTVRNFYYLFDKHNRWSILAECLKFLMKNKSFKLYSFVFMINHIHLICSSNDVAGSIRDFKSYTSHKLIKNIEISEPSILQNFKYKNQYNIWIKTNMPKLIESEKYFLQKQNYIHENPVRKQYVNEIYDWYWSSANDHCELRINS